MWEWRASIEGVETPFISMAALTNHHCRVAKSNIIYSLAVLGGERPVSRSCCLGKFLRKICPQLFSELLAYPQCCSAVPRLPPHPTPVQPTPTTLPLHCNLLTSTKAEFLNEVTLTRVGSWKSLFKRRKQRKTETNWIRLAEKQ